MRREARLGYRLCYANGVWDEKESAIGVWMKGEARSGFWMMKGVARSLFLGDGEGSAIGFWDEMRSAM
ncbi:hypothetical protein FRE64_12905 [Euhalothece natronophila Z-M001]|uniref:Uncharacterized protein n=1 Tax=Euhalothece natronophila Z-M001 TaxID=522448 RepID=A0A5B8NRQ4_9CHRO|nr:hypothetical protein [Euhalothece natronophila]QDZ40760.1 hypothetical protein FRE64_12905 [Euhalothece natronophila Z-M001]